MPKKKIIIGLTGGIGSGKSTVLKELQRLGAVTADADALVHEFLAPGGAAHARVARLFGPSVLRADKSLNRKAMAARVFTEPSLRRKLESILHPMVRRSLRKTAKGVKRGIVVLDIPLLFESKLEKMADRVCVVWAPDKVRLARLLKSKRFSRADVLRRFKAQLPLSEKRRRADDVVDNGGSVARTRAEVRRLWRLWSSSI